MKTLEELKRENRALKAQKEVREDFRKRNAERKKIARENSVLRSDARFFSFRKVGRGAVTAGKAFGGTLGRLRGDDRFYKKRRRK